MAVSAISRPLAEHERPVLSWPYVAVLLAEISVLGTLVALLGRRLPLTYELGWAGAGSMLAMQVYSIRRRVRALRTWGSLRAWLELHIFLGLQGFSFVAYHSVGIADQIDGERIAGIDRNGVFELHWKQPIAVRGLHDAHAELERVLGRLP